MKLLIASDIHGSAYWCEKLMALAESDQPDKLVLLGDLVEYGKTEVLFSTPTDKRTEDYITGRFG